MKTILLILFPFILFSQRYEVEEIKGTKYLVQRDTSENGVITEVKTPASQIEKELESKANSIESFIDNELKLQEQSNIRIKELFYQLDEINKLKSVFGMKVIKRSKSKKLVRKK